MPEDFIPQNLKGKNLSQQDIEKYFVRKGVLSPLVTSQNLPIAETSYDEYEQSIWSDFVGEFWNSAVVNSVKGYANQIPLDMLSKGKSAMPFVGGLDAKARSLASLVGKEDEYENSIAGKILGAPSKLLNKVHGDEILSPLSPKTLTDKLLKNAPEKLLGEKKTEQFATEWIKIVDNLTSKVAFETTPSKSFFADPSARNFFKTLGQGLGFITSVLLTKKVGGESMGMATSVVQMTPMYYEEAKNAGLSNQDAASFATTLAPIIGATEYFGLDLIGKVAAKPALNALRKESIIAGSKVYTEVLAKSGSKQLALNAAIKETNNLVGSGVKNIAVAAGKGAAIEGGEEFGQTYLEEGFKQIYDTMILPEAKFGADITSRETLLKASEGAFFGGILGGVLGAGHGIFSSPQGTEIAQQSMFNLLDGSNNKQKAKAGIIKNIESAIKGGKLSEVEGKNAFDMVESLSKYVESLPLTLQNTTAKYQAYQFITERDLLKEQLVSLEERGTDPTLAQADNEIKKILEDKIEIYDKAVSLIAKTKGQISDIGVQEAINLAENQFTKIEKQDEKTEEEEIENVQEENDVLNTPVQEQGEGKTEEVVAPPVPVIEAERTKEVIEQDIARAEKTVKNTEKEIKKLRGTKLRKDETQELRDAKIANLEAKKTLLENKINEFSAEIGSQEAGIEEAENIGEAVEAGDTGVSGEVESVGKIISSFDSNTAALVDKENGIGAVVRKIVEEQKPFKLRFLQKRGLTIEEYNKLGESEKEEIQNAWVNSDEFKALEEVSKNTETQQTKTDTTDTTENAKKETTGIDALEADFNEKSVEDLVALKKELYPNPDIESAMSPEEKLLDRVIAKKFSEKNQEVIKRREAKRQQKPESAEIKNLKDDIDELNRNLRNANSRSEVKRINKQIAQKKKMLQAAKKGIAFTEKPKLKRVGAVGVPNFIRTFEPVMPRDKVLHYFVSGGRVSRQSIEDSLGLFKTELVDGVANSRSEVKKINKQITQKKKRKVIKGKEEFKALRPMFSEKAPHYTDVANEMSDYEGGAAYDEMLSIFESVMGQGKKAAIEELRENIEKMNNAGQRTMTDEELNNAYWDALADEQAEFEAFTEAEIIGLSENPEIEEAVDITLDNLTQPQRAKLEALVNKYTVDGVTDYENILTQLNDIFGADEDILTLDEELNGNLEKILKQYEAERNGQQTQSVANKKAVIGENESDLNQKIESAKEEIRLAKTALSDKKAEIGRGINKEQPNLFGEGSQEVEIREIEESDPKYREFLLADGELGDAAVPTYEILNDKGDLIGVVATNYNQTNTDGYGKGKPANSFWFDIRIDKNYRGRGIFYDAVNKAIEDYRRVKKSLVGEQKEKFRIKANVVNSSIIPALKKIGFNIIKENGLTYAVSEDPKIYNKPSEAERNGQQTQSVANKKTIIGENESDLNQKIESAKEKLASAEQELADRERIVNKKVKEAAEDLFKGGVEKKGDLFGMEVDYSPENVDKILEPYRGRVETAKRNLEVLEQPINREQARDIDRRQREIKFEQPNLFGEGNIEFIAKELESVALDKNTFYRGYGGNTSKIQMAKFGDNVIYLTDNPNYANSFSLDDIGGMEYKRSENGGLDAYKIGDLKIYEVTEGQYYSEASKFNNKPIGDLSASDMNNFNDKIKNDGYDAIKIERIEPNYPESGISQQRNNDFVSELLVFEQNKIKKIAGAGDILNSSISPKKARVISSDYQKAKKDGTNPELVKAVEELIGIKPSEGALFQEQADLSQDNIDRILAPFQARIETAKRNLEVLEQPINREQARDIDRRQREIKFEQNVINNMIVVDKATVEVRYVEATEIPLIGKDNKIVRGLNVTFRGEGGKHEGVGISRWGKGLYTTGSFEAASGYAYDLGGNGRVVAYSDAKPKNPLKFSSEEEANKWVLDKAKEQGISENNFRDNLSDYLSKEGYDGINIKKEGVNYYVKYKEAALQQSLNEKQKLDREKLASLTGKKMTDAEFLDYEKRVKDRIKANEQSQFTYREIEDIAKKVKGGTVAGAKVESGGGYSTIFFHKYTDADAAISKLRKEGYNVSDRQNNPTNVYTKFKITVEKSLSTQEASADDILNNMEDNGDIKIDCE